MAFSSLSLSEDQFLCSICLDVFTDPVTTSCGHNFCKTCITGYWDNTDHCQCPMCKNDFETRPDLKVNTFISEMASQVKKLASVKDETKPLEKSPLDESGDVPCDLCTEKKVKALKSCLVCLASYCETHLEPHQILASFKRHKLIDPVENLEDRMCKKHERPLELFCKKDKLCVCLICVATDHKNHTTVPINDAYEEMKVELGKTEDQVQQMIQERQKKVQDIRNSVKVSEKNIEKEITDTIQVFTSVIRSIEKKQAEIIEAAERKQKYVERQAEETIKDLEQEIDVLQTRSSELKILSHSEDQLQLLKSSPSLCTLPTTKNMPEIKALEDRSTATVLQAVSDMKEILKKQFDDIKAERIKQCAVDVTLDPETAHLSLILSADRKEVTYGHQVKYAMKRQNLHLSPKRFDNDICVLANECCVSGKFYYEVEVNEYCIVGVLQESIDRKSSVLCNPANGVWSVGVSGGVYEAYADHHVTLSLKERLQTLGVFVDYENREVSFYNAETGSIIYSFSQCTFNEKLYPFFINKSTTPLILRPVNKTK